MDQILDALLTGYGMLWKALWALVFGYVISAGIQVLVTREKMAGLLGRAGPRQTGLASFFGFISSSCSFAALAASRSVLVKGTHPTNAAAFLIASTNLVIELGIVLWILLGWRFTAANFLLGVLMILYAAALMRLVRPRRWVEAARANAEAGLEAEGGAPEAAGKSQSAWDKLTSVDGWQRIASAFVAEVMMVWKEILFGFTVAGFLTVFVPQSFWNALFLSGGGESPPFLVVVENALVAPLVAFFTFIGSMGNVPLAAMLWSREVSFGGVMSFLGADLVAATVIWIHAKYYGWRYALYLSVILYGCMAAAGVTVHYLFALTGQIPSERPDITEQVRFAVDYTLFLNIAFLVVAGLMVWLARQAEGAHAPAH